MNDNLLNRLSLREYQLEKRAILCGVKLSFSRHKKDIRQIVGGPKMGINAGICGATHSGEQCGVTAN